MPSTLLWQLGFRRVLPDTRTSHKHALQLQDTQEHITYQVPDIAWLKRGGGDGKIQGNHKDAYKERERTKGLEKENRHVRSLWREESSFNSAARQKYRRGLGPRWNFAPFILRKKCQNFEISQNSDIFPHNSDFFSQNCEFNLKILSFFSRSKRKNDCTVALILLRTKLW